MAGILFLFIGPTIFEQMGKPVPELVTKMCDSKFMWIMVFFLIGNMVRNNLLATGAFEIYFDDELVFSKLNTNQIPSAEIINGLLTQYQIV